MKDPSVQYLAKQVPNNWKKYKLSMVADIQNGYPFDSEKFSRNNGHALVRIRDINSTETEVNYSGVWIDAATVHTGDTLIGMDGDFNVSAWRGRKALLNQRVCAVRAKKNFCNEYLRYYLPNALHIINELTYSTTVKHLSSGDIAHIELYAPLSIEAQRQIVNYLDYRIGLVDRVLAAKRKQQAQLFELRSVTVFARIFGEKPSKIDTLQMEKRPWKVSRAFKYVGSGITPKSGVPEYYDNGTVDWLITGDLKDSEITSISKKITAKAIADYPTLKQYPTGSLVVAMYGATIGKIGLLTKPSTVNQACCVLVPGDKITPYYAFYYFLAAKQQLIDLAVGGGQPNISQDIIKSFKIILPSIAEQDKIADEISHDLLKLDAALLSLAESIKHLKEYRTSLISNVITGKVEV